MATVFVLLSFLPWGLIFLADKAPAGIKRAVMFSMILFALGEPGAYLLDRFGYVGIKFGLILALTNWLIYFLVIYLLGWLYFVCVATTSPRQGRNDDR